MAIISSLRRSLTFKAGSPIHSPVLSDPKECNNRYSNLVGKNGRGGEKKKRGEREKLRAEVAGEDRTRAPSLVKTAL